jgi:hypothetical protein
MDDAIQYIERTSMRGETPMERWQMETQQGGTWNAVGSYRRDERFEGRSEYQSRDQSFEQWSTDGNAGTERVVKL